MNKEQKDTESHLGRLSLSPVFIPELQSISNRSFYPFRLSSQESLNVIVTSDQPVIAPCTHRGPIIVSLAQRGRRQRAGRKVHMFNVRTPAESGTCATSAIVSSFVTGHRSVIQLPV
jgi:hypothetical protein